MQKTIYSVEKLSITNVFNIQSQENGGMLFSRDYYQTILGCCGY